MVTRNSIKSLDKIFLLFGFILISILHGQDPHIIPKPKSLTVSGGTLELGTGSRIMYGDNSLKPSAEALSDHINRVAGVSLSVASGNAGGGDIGRQDGPADHHDGRAYGCHSEVCQDLGHPEEGENARQNAASWKNGDSGSEKRASIFTY